MIPRQLAAEALGTALLLISVVGSGIMGESLAGGNTAIALLANAIATGCMLYAIITVLGPISGAHFNPAVTIARTFSDTFAGISPANVAAFIAVQLVAATLASFFFRWFLAPAEDRS